MLVMACTIRYYLLLEVFRRTWNGVVQDKPEESSDEHVCGEEHYDHLVQLFYSFKHKREQTNLNHLLPFGSVRNNCKFCGEIFLALVSSARRSEVMFSLLKLKEIQAPSTQNQQKVRPDSKSCRTG